MARRTLGLGPYAVSAVALVVATGTLGCSKKKNDDLPALAKNEEVEVPSVPVPPANGPKLGAIAEVTPVMDRPSTTGKQIGYLHAGALVPRAEKPYTTDRCPGGWYPIRPAGFVCVGEGATLDLKHPTLAAMAQAPKMDQPAPFVYGRMKNESPLLERDGSKENAVKEVGKLRRRSIVAVVGSWNAVDPEGKMQRLALTPSGQFVKASDLEPVQGSEFKGVELGDKAELPVGFVVRRGVKAWAVEKGEAEKVDNLEFHQILSLTGKFRTVGPLKYWAMADGRFARHRDVLVVRKRNSWPDFAQGDQKWIDVSVVTNTVVLYEGKKPVFVTLGSTGRDRLGDPKTTASTAQGAFEVVTKHVTASKFNPKGMEELFDVHDAPWALELTSGQLVVGAPWHDRFGIENGQGQIQLSPADALRVWHWADPAIPDGWHGVSAQADKKVYVVVRK
ncbi:MAG: L,D-transpeptidase [Polyangiaceae bacterium]